MILVTFKNHGHFCNYCRKVLDNKVSSNSYYERHFVNLVLWEVYDKHPERIKDFMFMLQSIPNECTGKEIHYAFKSFMIMPDFKGEDILTRWRNRMQKKRG